MMKTSRWLALVILFAACGDGQTTSSPTPTTGLAGTWQGTLTLRVNNQPATTSTTTWTFVSTPHTSGLSYDTTVTFRDQWLSLPSFYLTSTLIGEQFGAHGPYHSPRGCEGSMSLLGRGDPRHIDASLAGSDCGTDSYDGTLTLTR
jgi:hypothetical protein